MLNQQDDILLVEDNYDDVELTLLALHEFAPEFTIKVAQNGANALNYLFCAGQYAGRNPNYQPKLILLDLKLPKIDGIQVLKQVKTDIRTHKIPVVVLTSSREESDLSKCYEIGVNSYVVKPMDVQKFRSILKQLTTYWLYINENHT